MAITVKTLPDPLPKTLACPTKGFLATFYATASGTSRDPSSIGKDAAINAANDQQAALTAAVAAEAAKWKPRCEEGCDGHIRIVSGPDHDTQAHEIFDRRHHIEIIGYEATLIVWEVVSATCVPSPEQKKQKGG